MDASQVVAAVVGIGCLLLWVTVAGRLGWVALRTRMAPESAMAGYFGLLSLATTLGIPTALLRNGGELERAAALSAAALGCYAFAAGALALGTWRTFRPASRATGVACAALLAVMLAAWWGTVRGGGIVSLNSATPSNLLFASVRLSIYVWAVAESFAHYQKLRRQIALGLASPVVARQILLWGAAAAMMAMSSVTILVRSRLLGVGDETRLTAGVMLILGLTVGAAISTWCAFFPPRFLRGQSASAQA